MCQPTITAATSTTTTQTALPEVCDYLIIGGGATGMAFVDTLFQHYHESGSGASLSVVMVDTHDSPGGQWHDSYNFVQLHQPSNGYGVESTQLEPKDGDNSHLATRKEILEYYNNVMKQLTVAPNKEFYFCGNSTFDFTQLDNDHSGGDNINETREYTIDINNSDGNNNETTTTTARRSIRVRKRLVDARNLQPDLPCNTPPKFNYNPTKVSCIPVNELVVVSDENTTSSSNDDFNNGDNNNEYYVIVGGGKTGMDAIVYLLKTLQVSPNNILWIMPNDAWITARENIGTCIELLHTSCIEYNKNKSKKQGASASTSLAEFFQTGFLQWEKEGKVYRIDTDIMPTKFKDATLSLNELQLIRQVQDNIVRKGRVSQITDTGDLVFENGDKMELPWKQNDKDGMDSTTTTFVHCSAGAFNCSKSNQIPSPIFHNNVITIQDVYGTPGFCFVGSIIARIECLHDMNDDDKNRMCLAPSPNPSKFKSVLGPSDGDITPPSSTHGWIQRACNLRCWLQNPELRSWLFNGNRLFHLGHSNAETVEKMVNEIFHVLEEEKIA